MLKNNWRNLNLTLYNLHTLHHTSTALLVLTKKILYISKHNLFKLFKSIIFKMMKKNSILILYFKKMVFEKSQSQSCRLTHITNLNIIFTPEQFE